MLKIFLYQSNRLNFNATNQSIIFQQISLLNDQPVDLNSTLDGVVVLHDLQNVLIHIHFDDKYPTDNWQKNKIYNHFSMWHNSFFSNFKKKKFEKKCQTEIQNETVKLKKKMFCMKKMTTTIIIKIKNMWNKTKLEKFKEPAKLSYIYLFICA